MKLLQIIFFLFFSSQFCYSQFTYKELINLRNKTPNEITQYLNQNKVNWKYSGYDKLKDKHTWKKGSDKLMVDYYSTNSRRIIYFELNLDNIEEISKEMGSTLEYKMPYKIDYDNEGLQIFKGTKYCAVVHTICTMTDTHCDAQIDIMTANRFNTIKY